MKRSHSLYNALIAPRAKDSDEQNREVVLNWLLVSCIVLAGAIFINTLMRLITFGGFFFFTRLFFIGLIVLFFIALYWLAKQGSRLFVEITLLGILLASALFILFTWGIINPVGLLMLCIVVVMAGILLGSRYSLFAATLAFVALGTLEIGKDLGFINPNIAWMREASTMTDVFSFTILLFILASVSWLFNRQMEVSLRRARKSEQALKRERDLLEVKVEERTRELQASQLEKMQQVYRFAELGRLSTALFHDLANHLSSMSLDIEGLKRRRQSEIVERIQQDIHYIDEVVQRVRQQMQGKQSNQRFDAYEEIQTVVSMLQFAANRAGVIVTVSGPEERLALSGDITRFRQIIINILSNAIESYAGLKLPKTQQPVVTVSIDEVDDGLQIIIADFGWGITKKQQQKIFEPFYTTKDAGVGIGLFIVRQVVEQDFNGTISVKSTKAQGTTFTIWLPAKQRGQRKAIA